MSNLDVSKWFDEDLETAAGSGAQGTLTVSAGATVAFVSRASAKSALSSTGIAAASFVGRNAWRTVLAVGGTGAFAATSRALAKAAMNSAGVAALNGNMDYIDSGGGTPVVSVFKPVFRPRRR